jgi:ribonuclease HII
MGLVAGIDEAGFGPILGPLVVSASMFSMPDELTNADLWKVLKRSVSKQQKHSAGRLLITDSKKAYSRTMGIKHLERTVLAALKCLGAEPATLSDLIATLCPECLERLNGYPWHKDMEACLLTGWRADVGIAASVFADDMSFCGIKPIGLRSSCLDVSHYNRLVGNVRNKARVLFGAVTQLMQHALECSDETQIHIVVDRQGGRLRYRESLQRSFSDMELRILQEDQHTSSYEMRGGDKLMRVSFVVDADADYLPVSLASMVSKYIRELLMESINRYFVAMHPNLQPTAGYWKDGLRFIKDLRDNLPNVQIDSDQLIRCR